MTSGPLAAEINTSMPRHVVDTTGKVLNELPRSYNDATILVLGVAYKGNIDVDTWNKPRGYVDSKIFRI